MRVLSDPLKTRKIEKHTGHDVSLSKLLEHLQGRNL